MSAGALASVLALTGCARTAPDPTAGVPAFTVDTPDVTLVEPGSNPRLLQIADGSADGSNEPWPTQVSVSTGIDQNVQTADRVEPSAPAGGDVDRLSLPLSVAAAPAPAPGDGEGQADRRVDFEVGAGTHSNLGLGQEVAAAEGFAMSWRTALSGAVETLKLLAPPDSSSTGRSLVESALLTITSTNVVFPTEPVGEGGSWTVTNRITGDAAMVRTTTYTVAGIDGDTVTLDVDVSERPAQRELTIDNDIAGELDGTTLTVEGTETTSEGEITVDLRRPLPVGGSVKATTRVIYAGPDSPTRIVQDITTAVEYGG